MGCITVVAGSLQHGPQRSQPPGFHTLHRLLPQRGTVCGPSSIQHSSGMSLLTLGYKSSQFLFWALSYSFANILSVFLSLPLFLSVSLESLLWGKSASLSRRNSGSQWKQAHGEELRPEDRHLDCEFVRTWVRTIQIKHIWVPEPQETMRRNHTYWLFWSM